MDKKSISILRAEGMKKRGYSTSEIANVLGVDESTVRQYLKEYETSHQSEKK